MRISTSMIFDAGISGINNQSSKLLNLQQQISSGRRLLTPSDDPVAAARALEVTQTQDILTQYDANQANATTALSVEDTQLQSTGDLLTQVKQLAVQGGNPSLGNSDRAAIATQLRAIFDQMVGIANSKDDTGQYLFSGYMSNTKPFAGTVANGVTYSGDDGQRALQVSATRQLAVSDSGSSVFNRIKAGNGTFATGYAGTNSGTGVIDAGSVTDPTKWNSVFNSGNLKVSFRTDSAGATFYDLVDANSGNSLFTGAASAADPLVSTGPSGSYTHAYTSGQQINFSGLAAPYDDFGASVTITGAPASGDSFSVASSTNQSVFTTMSNLITALERPLGSAANNNATKLTNDISSTLVNLDAANQNILTVRASIGARLNEADSIKSVNDSLGLQTKQTLSDLQDVDYTKAISDLTQTQTQLDAAQKSFAKVSQLSLFNYV